MSHEATELVLYAENDYHCYTELIMPVMRACEKHYDRQQGDLDRVIAGFVRVARPIAKLYAAEHCSLADEWRDIFTLSVRYEFACHLADYFLTEYRLGNRVGTQIASAAADEKAKGNTHE